jgi:hypothetical protein
MNRCLIVISCAICALAFAAHARGAESCECRNTSFSWAGCRDAAHCDQGGWTSCTASPDDSYTVEAGCHVDVGPGDDVLLEQPMPARFSVEDGGSVTVHGPVEWRVGPLGFVSSPGSRVELSGCFRRFAGTGPECADALGADALFQTGTVVPCRDGDCSGDAALVRLAYPDASEAQRAFLARLDVARDVLCFWQDDEQGYVGADAGYCYKIAAVGTDPTATYLDFDIRQVWRAQSDQAGYPLARREVQQGTLRGAHRAGTREIHLAETDVVAGRIDQMGRWVRCGTHPPFLIATVRDDPGGDVLVLADARGIDADYSDGERCWVDWGWTAGDVAFVMAPVHVTSSLDQSNTAFMRLGGAASLRAVVFDGLGGDGSHGRGAVQILGGPLERFEHVWVTDPLVDDREAVVFGDLPCETSAYHVTVTGGPPEAEYDKNYGLYWYGGPDCTYHLTHFYPRFQGDDSFVLESSGIAPVGKIVLRYVHSGPASPPGDSGQLFDFGLPNPSIVDAADVLCTACTTQDGIGQLVNPSEGGGTIARVLWVGAFNGGALGPSQGNAPTHLKDFGLIGAAVDPQIMPGHHPLAGGDTDGFYVRDVTDPRSTSSVLCGTAEVPLHNLRRGILWNVQTGSVPCDVDGGAQLSDLYFVDVAKLGEPGPLLALHGTANGADLTRLTMAFRAPLVGLSYGMEVGAGARARIDGPLLSGFRSPETLAAMHVGGPAQAALLDWAAPTCFFDDAVDDDPASLAAYGTPPLRGVDPLFTSPATGRFDLAPASPALAAGCGARGAGVQTDNWAHRKAKLRPLYMAQRAAPCGISAELAILLPLLRRAFSRGSRAASRRARGFRAGGPSA